MTTTQPADPAAPARPEGAAYLCFQSTDDGEHWAALLVVAASGLPMEFLYSGPLRVTPVQEILYQERLIGEVRSTLARALVRALRSQPVFLAVAAGEAGPGLSRQVPGPILLIDGDRAAWAGPASPAAETLARRLGELAGPSEPLGRARAALAYVVEYERGPRGRGE